MIRVAVIALALAIATPVEAKDCKGANRTLCAFAAKHRLNVISGYRPGATIRRTGRPSLHRYRRAIDVRRSRRSPRWGVIMRDARRRGLGIGVYCRRSGFLHRHFSMGRPEAGKTFYRGCRVRRAGR